MFQRLLFLGIGLLLQLSGPAIDAASALQIAPRELGLADLTDFRAAPENWRIVGGAAGDRNRESPLVVQRGTGVLVNLPSGSLRGHLFTSWEHGDLDLSLDYMLPKGADTGLFLLGRYELQIADSWAKASPTSTDAGAIAAEASPGTGSGRGALSGQRPLQNASRAPGLWQHLEVEFKAPRFDTAGRKIANARFERVALNGVVVQRNVEVTGPTPNAPTREEGPLGPLVLQGDAGGVALRNIRYKSYHGAAVKLTDLRYTAYAGPQMDWERIAALAPARTGTARTISSGVATAQDKFALTYEGTLTAPSTGRYSFELNLGWVDANPQFASSVVGGARLLIDGKEVLLHPGRDTTARSEVDLTAGPHPFSLTYYKNRPWTTRREITFYVEGEGVARQALHDESAVQQTTLPGAILVQPELEPVILRSFVLHGGRKRANAVSVAHPEGLNYSLDLDGAALLYAWRGPFMDASQMWHERGDAQVAEPQGSVVTFSGGPALAFLGDESSPWPDSVVTSSGLQRLGYELDREGRPTFLYRMGEVRIQDAMRVAEDRSGLTRVMRLAGSPPSQGLYLRLAEGERIERVNDGSWVIGDRTYYLEGARAGRPIIRKSAGRDELILPLRFENGAAEVQYSIIW